MARLIVNTLPDRNYIAAFVATAEGKPVLGLTEINFKVRATVPGADGSHLKICAVTAATFPGFYLVFLAPAYTPPPRKGLYVFDLMVESDADSGQSLTSVIMT